jgi:hypothetical protein
MFVAHRGFHAGRGGRGYGDENKARFDNSSAVILPDANARMRMGWPNRPDGKFCLPNPAQHVIFGDEHPTKTLSHSDRFTE